MTEGRLDSNQCTRGGASRIRGVLFGLSNFRALGGALAGGVNLFLRVKGRRHLGVGRKELGRNPGELGLKVIGGGVAGAGALLTGEEHARFDFQARQVDLAQPRLMRPPEYARLGERGAALCSIRTENQ